MEGKSDPVEDLIRDIAGKHGIAVGRDDPIMILHTINERLMRDTQQAQQAALEGFRSEIELISHRWGKDAKEVAERILSAAHQASRDDLAASINEASRLASDLLRKELTRATAPAVAAASKVQRAAWIAFGGGCMAFLASVVAWLVARH